MALKVLLACWIVASPALSSPEDRIPGHSGVVWPAWYRDRLQHARHDVVPETSTARNPWRPQATRLAQRTNSRHHVEQRTLEHNFSGAVAMTEHGGTKAIAYASYHGNHRHQPREDVTQSYQLIPTTAPTYTRHHSGRRVCTRQQATSHHHREKQIRLILGYTELTSGFFCCPGWSQISHLSFGCNKPTCPCLNGGICTSPGKCTCPKGYVGNQCQTDVDECTTEKPCGQLCTNLPGSYRCHCRVGFQLQEDGQSCRRNGTDENAFEARDLESDFHDGVSATRPTTSSHDTENEVGDDAQDYEIILKRLTKLEKQVARNRKRDTETAEMNTKVTLAVESVNEMRRTVENVQLMQQEVYDMRSKMKQYEVEMRKMQHLMNRVADLESRLRLRCRSPVPISGSLNF
ncbi:PREDICTED: protocadherin Fat 4 [Dinoponera quadriceps]|uniref:Protocadherin Fat 4 n=1 Tax=Dinoponera quadriceps TaxID=609295 RepID=A0A6P3WYZ1_DINQU|nr:PREDICTED: protocadherin Fat 4 [Dinoponera quadriceps]